MTLLSLADGCRLLAIDPKTLRRWLAQAQLTLQPHPTDARLKGLTGEQLLLLATAHRRSLPALPQELAAPPPPRPPEEPPPLPAELLALLPTLTGLPAQIAALQQQLAALTQRLDQLPSVPVCSASDGAGGVHPPTPAKAAARSRPSVACATKRPGPPARVLPLVEYGTHGGYVVICPKHGLLPFEPDTPEWFAWLATLSSFRFVGRTGRLTAHREIERLPRAAWRAHRQIHNHTYNVRLGSTESLTIAALEQAAAALHAHLK